MSWMDVLKALVLVGGIMLMGLGLVAAVRKMDEEGW